MRYLPLTDLERQEMLASLGLERIEDLFQGIPREIISEGLDVPGPLSEAELLRHFRELAGEQRRHTACIFSRRGCIRPPDPQHH